KKARADAAKERERTASERKRRHSAVMNAHRKERPEWKKALSALPRLGKTAEWGRPELAGLCDAYAEQKEKAVDAVKDWGDGADAARQELRKAGAGPAFEALGPLADAAREAVEQLKKLVAALLTTVTLLPPLPEAEPDADEGKRKKGKKRKSKKGRPPM